MKRTRTSRRSHLAAEALAIASIAGAIFCLLPARGLANTNRSGPSGGTPRRRTESTVRLPGHVLPALAHATRVVAASNVARAGAEPLTLTLVLNRDHQPAFDRYLRDLSDQRSPNYRRFLSQGEIADRFGPGRRSYDRVLGYLRTNGLELVEGSRNRLTLTVRGTRTAVERAFDVGIHDYQIGDRIFYANDADPALPPAVASHVHSIAGLSNFAKPRTTDIAIPVAMAVCALQAIVPLPFTSLTPQELYDKCLVDLFLYRATGNFGTDPPPPSWLGMTGAGQTVGLLEFDTFQTSDVVDFLDLAGLPAGNIGKLSRVHVNGGAPAGANEAEVLLDIDTVMTIAQGANVVVYDAPFTGRGASFQSLFNRMIDDGVTIISNSWAYCEDQTTAADVESIDAIFQNAAMSHISIFNGAGDNGSTCLDGGANVVHVPADSPNATAVGGTSLTVGPGIIYGSETWWDGAAATPPSGQGGFGVSKFFSRPSYQDGFTTSPMRSVPDVALNADPAHGVVICQASAGGCPTGLRYGGTSAATPRWAAFTAILNEAQGQSLGFLNPTIYPLANTNAFHGPGALGTDFAHVGLGSPNLNALHLLMAGQVAGLPAVASSEVRAFARPPLSTTVLPGVAADGDAEASVVVILRDALGNTVSGKTVTLAANAGSHATIVPPSGVSNVANGAVVFTLKDLTAETVTVTATDVTDGIGFPAAPVPFSVPLASAAAIQAFPTTVTADGASATTITVTLKDALNRPAPGKTVTLSQGGGHSVITGPNPPVTDGNGHIAFTATDQVNETVTYTAVDVTDGELPVPGNASVTFNNGAGTACGNNATPPTGMNGFTVTPFATGFSAGSLSYGGINFMGCFGASTPAFRSGDVYVSDFLNGDLFRLGANGGAVSSANRLSTLGPTLGGSTVGKDGRLYAVRVATNDDATAGVIVELDPDTGTIVRTVASNLHCPFALAVDPLSGDLFFDDGCSGFASDPTIHRVRNPAGASPTVEVYATLSTSPNGNLSFAPNGSLYVVAGYFGPTPAVVRVSGTNGPSSPTVTTLPGLHSFFWVNVADAKPDGEARSLILLFTDGLELVDLTTDPPTKTVIAQNLGGGVIGPDGCLYASTGTGVSKLTDATGGCSFLTTNANPSLGLTPAALSPNPLQGNQQTFTATFRNLAVPVDTPVLLQVTGANYQLLLGRTDAEGTASFSYAATSQGVDRLVATATVGGTPFTSNVARVTWAAGKHMSFLTLNPSVKAGVPGESVPVTASLTDSSVEPPVPVAGATVDFTLDAAHCSGVTDADGLATCQLTLPAVTGITTLTANFAATPQLVVGTDTVEFSVVGAALGHFLAYKVAPTKGTAKFAKFGPVTLADATFAIDAGYDVLKPLTLASPTNKNGEGYTDVDTHLEAFAVKLAKGNAKFQKRVDVNVANQCGNLFLTATKPVSILVPTAEDPTQGVTPPLESAHDVDHFLCYAVKTQKKRADGTPVAQFTKGTQVDVVDVTDPQQTRRYDLKKVASVCNPVAKSGTPIFLAGPLKGTPMPVTPADIRNPGSHLVCYAATLAKKRITQNGCGPTDPKDKGTKITPAPSARLAQLGVHVANQFGTGQLDSKKATLLCVPSTIAP